MIIQRNWKRKVREKAERAKCGTIEFSNELLFVQDRVRTGNGGRNTRNTKDNIFSVKTILPGDDSVAKISHAPLVSPNNSVEDRE